MPMVAPVTDNLSNMASRRVPLASNPNAINSPLRPTNGVKRSRTQVGGHDFDLPPPKKKQQLVEPGHHGLRRTQPIPFLERDGRAFEGRAEHAVPLTEFQRKLVASRDTLPREQSRQQAEKEHEKTRSADKEQIKTWQKHYRRVFPSFVFYFESIPHDAAVTSSRAVASLGAREEKFFSINVTHVVTTRPIPSISSGSDSRLPHPRHADQQTQAGQSKTINPSLLERQNTLPKYQSGRDLLSQRRTQFSQQENENRRHSSASADVLVKAQEMGKKIWPLEKFERMLNTLLDLDSDKMDAAPTKKGHAAHGQSRISGPEPDLSQLLRNEKNMPSDRLPWSDVMPFRNFYVFIHDAEERNKPVMVREYAKPSGHEEGDWPQLHCVQAPRCPFVAETPPSKNDETEREDGPPTVDPRRVPDAPRTRAVSAAQEAELTNPSFVGSRKRPIEIDPPREMGKPRQPDPSNMQILDPQPPQRHCHSLSNATDTLPPQNRFQFHGVPRPNAGREPLASGLQQSNQTSAIRSQMISSTSANPAARRGRTKEMHELQRRAFEQRRGMSTNMNDIRAAINNPASAQGGHLKQKQPTTLAKIREDDTQSAEEEEEDDEYIATKGPQAPKKKKASKREPKPGYCENCRDKYDDFHEHIAERKHRKFALTAENWTELDSLLKHLARK